jgi:hypothetical protein
MHNRWINIKILYLKYLWMTMAISFWNKSWWNKFPNWCSKLIHALTIWISIDWYSLTPASSTHILHPCTISKISKLNHFSHTTLCLGIQWHKWLANPTLYGNSEFHKEIPSLSSSNKTTQFQHNGLEFMKMKVLTFYNQLKRSMFA